MRRRATPHDGTEARNGTGWRECGISSNAAVVGMNNGVVGWFLLGVSCQGRVRYDRIFEMLHEKQKKL